MINDIPVRFFTVLQGREGDLAIQEITEDCFTSLQGDVEYERHTVHANGVRQICLTLHPLEGCLCVTELRPEELIG